MMPALDKPKTSYSRTTIASINKTRPGSSKSTPSDLSTVSVASTKPLNVFHVWYTELCRRQNTNPINGVRSQHHKNDQVLDFTADRIKLEDWQPIINALRLDTSLHVISIHSKLTSQKFLEEADSEDKVKRIKKWFGAICTKYVLRNLLKAIGNCLKKSTVLTCLELDGLGITGEYLTAIVQSLSTNKGLKFLCLKCCPIGDDGCLEICSALHSAPNIEAINLSGCNLGPKSAEHLAKLIKYQQINRYCESWHSSLRYEDPVVNNMAGLKRITINNNPKIGDDGLYLILEELVDDLWIKALDMQRCNITENIGGKILDVLQYSRSLEVADFRHNNLAPTTIERILDLLKEKQGDDTSTEYQWCFSSTTIATSSYGTYTSVIEPKLLSKTYKTTDFSVDPKLNATKSKTVSSKFPSKRTTTVPDLQKNSEKQKDNKDKLNLMVKPDNQNITKTKEQLVQMYQKLKEETGRRELAEKKCESLHQQIDELMNEDRNKVILREIENIRNLMSKFIAFVKAHNEIDDHDTILKELQLVLNNVQDLAKPFERTRQLLETCKEESHPNTPVDSEPNRETEQCKLQNLFKSMLGESTDSSSSINELDLDLSSCSSNQDVELDEECNSLRSSDSDTVETYRKLLEELSKDDDMNSGVDLSSRSVMSEQPIKIVINMPNSDS